MNAPRPSPDCSLCGGDPCLCHLLVKDGAPRTDDDFLDEAQDYIDEGETCPECEETIPNCVCDDPDRDPDEGYDGAFEERA